MPQVVICCALGLILSSLSGCSTFSGGGGKKKAADPILGEVHPQSNAPYGPTPPAEKDKAKSTETGQKSSANTSADPQIGPRPLSIAHMASLTKPLPGSKTLAISDSQAPGALQLTGNAEPVVRPVPRDPAFVNNSWVAPPTSASSNFSGPGQFVAQPSNFVDPQAALLQSRGITQHRVDPLPDGRVRLIAVAPERGNSAQLRTYEVTARDIPEAVGLVVQQIDAKR
jgi:hypothetical protein